MNSCYRCYNCFTLLLIQAFECGERGVLLKQLSFCYSVGFHLLRNEILSRHRFAKVKQRAYRSNDSLTIYKTKTIVDIFNVYLDYRLLAEQSRQLLWIRQLQLDHIGPFIFFVSQNYIKEKKLNSQDVFLCVKIAAIPISNFKSKFIATAKLNRMNVALNEIWLMLW